MTTTSAIPCPEVVQLEAARCLAKPAAVAIIWLLAPLSWAPVIGAALCVYGHFRS